MVKKEIASFHYITQDLDSVSHAELTQKACSAGVKWVQLRVKNKSYDEWLSIACDVKSICDVYGSMLIINDNVQIALETGAAGVHLGKEDMNPQEARKLLGEGFIIGGTANTSEDVLRLQRYGVDYIGIGPFRFTSTKQNLSPVLGLEGLSTIAVNPELKTPLIAVGGIRQEDVELLMEAGISG